jgi:hypothetical protein
VILVRKKSSKKDSEGVETQDIISEAPPESFTSLEPTPVLTQQQDETLEE